MIRIVKTVEEITNNKVKCIVVDISDAEQKEFEVTLSKEECELIEALNSIQTSAKLYAPTMNVLWSKIQAYSDLKYEKGKSEIND